MTGAMTTGLTALRAAIDLSGYYPALVADSVETVLGQETVLSHLVHQETTLDESMDLRRHVTVLVLTPTRLLVAHADEHGSAEARASAHATTACDALPLGRIGAVGVGTVVGDPAAYQPGSPPQEVTLLIGWGGRGLVDLSPADCGDEQCEADHGYAGTVISEDLALRVSAAGDGPEAVSQALVFAGALSRASAELAAR